MSFKLLLDNLEAYSLQVGLLVALAAFVPTVLRMRQPGARLIYWHVLLVACLLLPFQPWKQAVLQGTVQVTTVITAIHPVHSSRSMWSIPRTEIALLLLAAGVLVRLGWLAAGFWKLRRFRLRSRPLEPAPSWSVEASLRVSDDVVSPVTFGWRKPVVLLPARFATLDRSVQEAILCHEILHVRRGDWLFTVAEEVVRAVLWFHPAIWWLLGEVGLAREQEVDRLAIEITREKEEYMDALLAIAGARSGMDLAPAPAPLFLRKRHLKQRVILILKESGMSKKRLIPVFCAGLMVLAGLCWVVTGAFPLMAEPQVVNDAPGVTVVLNGATLQHRAAVPYPTAAIQGKIEGAVSVEVKTDSRGNVADARIVNGPEELRRGVLQSVLQWHFTSDAANSTRVVQVQFVLPPQRQVVGTQTGESVTVTGTPQAAARPTAPGQPQVFTTQRGVVGGVQGGVLGGIIGSVPTSKPISERTVREIVTPGMSDRARIELMAKLPVHEGDTYSTDTMMKTIQAAREYDEHLIVTAVPRNESDLALMVTASSTPQVDTPQRIKVGGNVVAVNVITKVPPIYPELAKSARVSGVVHLAAIIAGDGTVKELHSLGGPALLIQAAMDAVKQWVYKPTLLNGAPVEVETTIDVNFTLNQ